MSLEILGISQNYNKMKLYRYRKCMEICELILTNLCLLNVESLITFLFQHCYNKIYVASQNQTASKGRLCYDYRKINSYVKTKQFPLTNSKTQN